MADQKGIKAVRERLEQPEDIPPIEGLAPPGDDIGADVPPRTPDTDSAEILPQKTAAKFPLNDVGNGKRFALYFGENAMPVPRVGWFVWNGMVWAKDPDDIAIRSLAQKVSDRIVGEIPHLELEDWQARELDREPDVRRRYRELTDIKVDARTVEQQIEIDEVSQSINWIDKIKERRGKMKGEHRLFAKSTGNKAKIDAMLVEATVDLFKTVDDLDSDPLAINTKSGVLLFKVDGGPGTGFSKTAEMKVMPHDRRLLITKIMPLGYDPDAKAPLFDEFMERIQPDAKMRGFLQRWLSLSMTALTGEQKFAFFYGSGANGKSVLVDLIARMFGDYATTAKIESLTGRNRRGGGDATPDLMPLVGARMVRASEPEEGERLQEGTIKELTGGEPVLVRALHSDFIEVHPHFKLTISGNHKPDIRGTDDGIWRRVLLVPFDISIPAAERDEKLGEKLWLERDGIFRWLVDGLIDYLESGLQEPDEVLEATQEYRDESDPIGTFLKDSCVVSGNPSDFTTARDLMDGFNLWLDLKGEAMWGSRTVSLKIKHLAGRYRDPTTKKTFTPGKQRVTGYRGLRFTDMFKREFEKAPRNNSGHPVAQTARTRADE
jgi:putative DNA primase/helicase